MTLVYILIAWFLVSIPASLLVGRVLSHTSRQHDPNATIPSRRAKQTVPVRLDMRKHSNAPRITKLS
jgi:hypothetical protein